MPVLTTQEAALAVRLLGKFQTFLERAIEETLIPGEREPREEIDKEPVRLARIDWRATENLIQRLEASREKKKAKANRISAAIEKADRETHARQAVGR